MFQDIAAAANVFAYQGDLVSAAKAIDLADQVRREVIQHPGSPTDGPLNASWRRIAGSSGTAWAQTRSAHRR